MRKSRIFKVLGNRSFVLVGIMTLTAFLLIGRLFWVQVVESSRFVAMGQRQTEDMQKLYSPRGTIYDRNGKKLAFSVMVKSLYADPGMLSQSPADTAAVLAPVLKMDQAELQRKLSRETRFVWLERVMDQEMSRAAEKAIKDKGLKGLGFVEESKRYYPNGSLLANVLGFVGIDGKGLDGLEMSLDKDIRGSVDRQVLLTDGRGNPILHSTMAPYLAEKGQSVYLTIDESIQFFAERALDRAMAKTHSEGGIIIVMDPQTGGILAMANRPSYDPNRFFLATEAQFKNRAVVDMYEPGSTFKPVIAAAALAAGTYTTDTVFSDPGEIWVSGHRIQNWDEESHGNVKLVDIIKLSLNTGFAHIGLLTGGPVLTDYAKRFGFGQPTGIELPGEGRGLLFADPEHMRDSDVATMAIGQSIAVTPLQMVQAYSALANGGKLVRPHIIASIKNPDGSDAKSFGIEEKGQAVPQEIANTVRDMMEREVSEGGGQMARVPGYKMAGKTGTAEKLDTVHGGYLDNQYIASFAGFGPADKPAAVCLVVLDNPRGLYYGGLIAAPVFSEVMGQVMRYMGIHADNEGRVPAAIVPKSAPKVAVPENSASYAFLPDFRGWTMGDTGDWLSQAGLGFMPEGTGYADRQSPGPGTQVKKGENVKVHFSP